MNLNKQQFKTEIAGRTLTLEVSDLAGQANAAVLGSYGDTAVLVTVTMAKEDKNIGYFPLIVDYEEKFYAAGKIIGSRFIRREGRPSENATLSARLIDRSIRPLFDKRIRRDVQIIITVLSYDEANDPDFIALLSASTALNISDIPWQGPIAGLRLAKTRAGQKIINPTNPIIAEDKNLVFDAFVSGTENKINMIELSGNEAEEKEVIESFGLAHQEIKKLIDFQKKIAREIGGPKAKIALIEPSPELKRKVNAFLENKLENALYTENKIERQNKLTGLKEALKQGMVEGENQFIDDLFDEEIDKLIHRQIIESEKRPDGRRLDEIRPLYAEIGLFKRLHGSALFTRGNTQSLTVTTLAAPGAEQLIETIELSAKRRFMLHYNFPPYSTGETGRMGSPGRREIGHGSLAEKALRPVIPTQDEFPYTIRVVSEILSSNGSSSMATVCAGSMSLMDAGVPIKKSVGGIAMGLMIDQQPTTKNQKPKYKILTDIQGPEDSHGDMDLKIAGTNDGITAIQMDVKIEGINVEMLSEILAQAQKARLEILEAMNKAIDKPRSQISPFAPIIMTLEVDPSQIGGIIGPGGKVINKIIADTGVETIDIEESGRVFVASRDHEKAQMAIRFIKSITREFKVGEIIEGKVIKILDFGAIVDLGAGKDGMIHISELKNGYVEKVEDVVKIGDIVKAKVVKVENGRIGLSLKGITRN